MFVIGDKKMPSFDSSNWNTAAAAATVVVDPRNNCRWHPQVEPHLRAVQNLSQKIDDPSIHPSKAPQELGHFRTACWASRTCSCRCPPGRTCPAVSSTRPVSSIPDGWSPCGSWFAAFRCTFRSWCAGRRGGFLLRGRWERRKLGKWLVAVDCGVKLRFKKGVVFVTFFVHSEMLIPIKMSA